MVNDLTSIYIGNTNFGREVCINFQEDNYVIVSHSGSPLLVNLYQTILLQVYHSQQRVHLTTKGNVPVRLKTTLKKYGRLMSENESLEEQEEPTQLEEQDEQEYLDEQKESVLQLQLIFGTDEIQHKSEPNTVTFLTVNDTESLDKDWLKQSTTFIQFFMDTTPKTETARMFHLPYPRLSTNELYIKRVRDIFPNRVHLATPNKKRESLPLKRGEISPTGAFIKLNQL